MSTERWLRINTSWSDSDWLFEQPPAVRLAWIELLCYVKRDGVRGRAKAMSDAVASNKWRVPKDAVVTLRSVAVTDGALQIDDGDWVIVNWSKYQAESLERVQRFREKERTKEMTLTETKTETGGVTRVTFDTLRNVTECGENAKKVEKEENILSLSPTTSAQVSAFDRFWSIQLRKVGKGAAIKAWKKQKCDSFADKVMSGYQRYVKARQASLDAGVFTPEVPHPSTWLNEGRWDDEPEVPDSAQVQKLDEHGRPVGWENELLPNKHPEGSLYHEVVIRMNKYIAQYGGDFRLRPDGYADRWHFYEREIEAEKAK